MVLASTLRERDKLRNKNKGGGGGTETGLSLLPTENKSIKCKCLDKCQSKKGLLNPNAWISASQKKALHS